ncbi:uncharacterized protein PV09_05216 [Verruconis gallopava]|uniref:Uncharacterized protein n=1 Tax=Verruconis gallopava TaxID=253628 RepID=A0A0D1XM10_9PEZI|nr:uncharacterized protein PV09_05216 [Verruconis gallopava]KIW03446.1 hypothetical protein PV09_05216 [Verruconis gallopava]
MEVQLDHLRITTLLHISRSLFHDSIRDGVAAGGLLPTLMSPPNMDWVSKADIVQFGYGLHQCYVRAVRRCLQIHLSVSYSSGSSCTASQRGSATFSWSTACIPMW